MVGVVGMWKARQAMAEIRQRFVVAVERGDDRYLHTLDEVNAPSAALTGVMELA